MPKRQNPLKEKKEPITQTHKKKPNSQLKPRHLFMKMYAVKIVAVCAIVLMVSNFLLLVLQRIETRLFWVITLLCATIAFMVVPWIRGVMARV